MALLPADAGAWRRRGALVPPLDSIFKWRLAAHARQRRAILAARRTGRGTWYAVVIADRQERGHDARQAMQAHLKGANWAEAVDVGRRLISEKADWLGPDVTIDVQLYYALE